MVHRSMFKLVPMLLVVCAVGCGDEEAAPAEPTPGAPPLAAAAPAAPAAPAAIPTVALDEAQQAKAAEIVAAVTPSGSLPSAITSEKTNALVFLHLAAQSDDENVTRAALSALRGTWTSQESQVERGSSRVDDTFANVVLARMADERGPVQQAAYRAAAAGIMGDTPNTALLDALVEAAQNHPTPAGRFAALDELWNASSNLQGNADRLAPFVHALDAPEPWLVSIALFRLNSLVNRYPDAEALKTKCLALTQHADPGVRGRAAVVLGNLASWPDNSAMKSEVGARLLEMLSDDNPFAKSAAMNSLARMRHVPALHALMDHLEDATSNTYDITGFQELDGSTGRVHHDGSAWSEVRDSALGAVKTLSGEVDRANRFDYRINYQTKDDDIAAAVAAARQWFQSHEADIPAA